MLRSSSLSILALALLVGACTSPPASWHTALDQWERTTAPADGGGPSLLDEQSSLEELLDWAEHHAPDLTAAAQHWKAALQRVPQVGDLPDPQITMGYFLQEVQTRTGPMDWRVGISQQLPWFGELDLADEAAMATAGAAAANFEAAWREVHREVRDAYAELAYVATAIEVTAGHRELLTSWEDVARSRYATGLGNEADVIRAQVELGKLDDQLRTLQDLVRPLSARLNAALDRPSQALLPAAQLEDTIGGDIDDEALMSDLGTMNPGLVSLDQRIVAAEKQLALAETDAFPDFVVGADFTAVGKGGKDAVALNGGLRIPIRRGRIRAAIAQAQAELAAVRAERRQAENELRSTLALALYRRRDAQRRIRLFRDTLVAKGLESVQAITVAYQSGDDDFLDLVDAERVLLEFQLAVARAQADRTQANARIAAIAGPDSDQPPAQELDP